MVLEVRMVVMVDTEGAVVMEIIVVVKRVAVVMVMVVMIVE